MALALAGGRQRSKLHPYHKRVASFITQTHCLLDLQGDLKVGRLLRIGL